MEKEVQPLLCARKCHCVNHDENNQRGQGAHQIFVGSLDSVFHSGDYDSGGAHQKQKRIENILRSGGNHIVELRGKIRLGREDHPQGLYEIIYGPSTYHDIE